MFDELRKSSKLFSVLVTVLMATFIFATLSYAQIADVTTFGEFRNAVQASTTTTINVIGPITATVGEGGLGTQASNDLTINGNNHIVDANGNAGMRVNNKVLISSITMSSFTSTFNGGAIYAASGSTTTIGSGTEFSFNKTYNFGGAIWNRGEITTGKEVVFSSNTALFSGGALYASSGSSITIGTDSIFTSNFANFDGGAIYATSGSTTTISSGVIFSSNSAKSGGAIYAYNGSKMTFEDEVVFSSNTAQVGGAICNDGDVTIGKEVVFSSNTANVAGGAIYTLSGSTTTIGDGVIFSSNSANSGGAIYVFKGSTMTIGSGVKFSSNTANVAGGAIYADSGSTTTIGSNSNFSFNVASSSGGAIYNTGAMEISGSTFESNQAENNRGGAIYNAGTMVISDSKFDSNEAKQAGAILVGLDTGKLTVKGSTFTHNTATEYGGAIHISGEAVINDSVFSNNSAKWGGAIYSGTKSSFTITNSSFINNKAEEVGALGVFKNATLTNVTFTSNTATSTIDTDPEQGGSGAIFFGSEATAKIDGGIFEYNESGTAGGAIGTRRAEAGNHKDAKLDIKNSIFRGNTAEIRGGAIDNYFYNDSANSGSVYVGNTIFDSNEAAQGGAIYNHGELDNGGNGNAASMTVDSATFVRNTATDKGGAIYNAGRMAISDSVFDSNEAAQGGAVFVSSIGYLTVNGSTFTNNTSNSFSGAIHVSGEAEISDSVFSENSAGWAGAIYAGTVSSITITNTKFINNEAESSIGALGVFKNATLKDVTFTGNVAKSTFNLDGSGAIFFGAEANAEIDGGVFEYNESITNAGAIGTREYINRQNDKLIDLSAAKLDIKNSTFVGNKTGGKGGAINNHFYNSNTSNGSVYVGNTIFDSNEAAQGGAIYNHGELDKNGNAASMTVDSATFSGNKATGSGGAVYNAGTMAISDSVFDSNTAANAGAVFVSSIGYLTVNGSTFTNNTSAGWSGAIYVAGEAEINDSEFSNNKARWAGAIAAGLPSSSITITNTKFINNEAEEIGALGIFYNATLNNVTFTGNVATSTDDANPQQAGSGAIFFGAEATAEIDGGIFEYNESNTSGGAIGTRRAAVANNANATLDIKNSRFTGNVAATRGGAIDNYFYNDSANSGSVYVGNTIFDSNEAAQGGAIYNHGELDNGGNGNAASMTVDSATFSGNIAKTTGTTTGKGGAIYNAGTMVVSRSTFDSNEAAQGGAIWNSGKLTIEDETNFSSNTAKSGGAIYNIGEVTIGSHTTFISNEASWQGGAIYNEFSSTMTIGSDSTFSLNKSNQGGAIRNSGELTIDSNSDFSENSATTAGGAIWNSGKLAISSGSNFSENSAEVSGGAIYANNGSTITIGSDSTFSLNKAGGNFIGNGGAIYAGNGSSITINSGSKFDSNEAVYGGGGAIYIEDESEMTIGADSEFTDNKAGYDGGAIRAGFNSILTIGTGANFTDNKADDGGAIWNYGETTISSNTTFDSNMANWYGGAIYNTGSLNIGDNVLFTLNYAKEEGGAIYNAANSTVTFNGSATFEKNMANGTSNDIYSDGELYFLGGTTTMQGGIVGAGTTTINGAVVNFGKNAILEQYNLEISANSELSVNAENLIITSDTISNDGSLNFTAGTATLANNIVGVGTTTLSNANITIDSTDITQYGLNISSTSTLTSNADRLAITSEIVNDGILKFTGGNNNNTINGGGDLVIAGDVTNGNYAISQNSIEITENNSFTTDADYITTANGILNDGNLTFTGGTNTSTITATTGKGELFVTGNVTNTASITQSTISITGSLESNVNDIKATEQILNDGALIFTGIGTNTNIIDGFGDLIIEGNIENAPGKTIDQNLINVTAGNSFTTVASDITTLTGILNDGSLTFTGGINTSTITTPNNSGDLFVTGDLLNTAAIEQSTINVESNIFENVRGSSITAQILNASTTFRTDALDLNIADIVLGDDANLLLVDDIAADLNANINGNGSLIKEGDGTVTLNGTNEYAGPTTIGNGALRIGSATNISDGADKVIYMDGGTLITTADMSLNSQIVGTVDAGGANNVNIEVESGTTILTTNSKIYGEGDLVKTGAGVLDLQMLSNNYSGNTVVNSGTLRGTTNNINGLLKGSGANNFDTFEFYDANSDVVLNEVDTMAYIGTFNKTGSSTMTIINNFQAAYANILAGTFVINNDATMGGSGNIFTVDNDMIVNNALLKGYGDINVGKLIIGNGATFAPGNSTTTFKVTGDLEFTGDGEYDVEFGQFSMDAAGHYNDNTNVTGTATIGADAKITLNNLEGKYYVHETIDLINAGFLLDGYAYQDANVVFNDNDARELRPGYDTRISTRIYTEGNALKIDLVRKVSEYGITKEFYRSHNEQQAATAIDNVSTGNGGDITLPLDVMEHFFYYKDPITGEANIPALKAALNDVAGVIHANSTMLTFTNAKIEHVYDKVQKRSRDLYPCTKFHNKVWAQYYYNTLNVKENENSPEFDASVNGFLVGFDMISAANWTMGITAGYGTSELKQSNDQTIMNDFNFGFYGGYETDSWLFKAMLLGGYEQYQTDRDIRFMNRIANSEYNGFGAALDLEAGYKIALNRSMKHRLTLKPFVGFTGNYINQDGFEEKGAESLNLKVEGYDNMTAQARVGVGVNGTMSKFGWYAKAGVRQLLTEDYNEIETSLLDYQNQTKMKIQSAEMGTLSYGGGLGADYALSDDWTIFANGLVSFADKSNNYYGNIGLTYKFGCVNNVEKTSKEAANLRKALETKEKELNAAKEREKELQNRIQKYEATIVSEEKAQQMKEKTVKTVRLNERPTFMFGSDELTEGGRESLRQLAKELEQYPDAEILIEGHTDSMGSEQINQKISENRASKVATTLKKDFGVQNDISVIGKGKSDPIAPNDTAEGRALNRRVEFIITTK